MARMTARPAYLILIGVLLALLLAPSILRTGRTYMQSETTKSPLLDKLVQEEARPDYEDQIMRAGRSYLQPNIAKNTDSDAGYEEELPEYDNHDKAIEQAAKMFEQRHIDDYKVEGDITDGDITEDDITEDDIHDADMSKMRSVYKDQQTNRQRANLESSLADLHYSILPEVQCTTMVRLGKAKDGGKWTCNPWRLGNDCIVYSLGVGGKVDFETEVTKYTDRKCEIHSFDPNAGYAHLFRKLNTTTFHPWKITAKTDETKRSVSIRDTMEKLGHKTVSIFKIDIEGSEYVTLPSMMKGVKEEPYFCQLLIEVHGSDTKKWIGLLKIISKGGFLLFAKEVNAHCKGGRCVEYGYIHRNCLQRFGIQQIPLHRNYAEDMNIK